MTTIAVTAPVPAFTGSRAGVVFRNGRGEVEADDASALAYFARHGYIVEARPNPAKKELSAAAAEKPSVIASKEGEPSHA
jgi:hypothetical protein